MFSKKQFCWVLLFLGSLSQYWPTITSLITIRNNGYQGIVIAINPSISYDPNLILRIKEVWTNTSQFLFETTNRRIYFRNITILVPKTWNQGSYERAVNETYDAADVIIADPNPLFLNQPYVVQYGGCGLPGSYIHITPEFLTKNSVVRDFGPRHKALIHEWAHFRWGIFDEYPSDESKAFYFNETGGIEATKCPNALEGKWGYINQETGSQRACRQNFRTGLPEKGCKFIPYESQTPGLNVSLMSYQFLTQVNSFCHSNWNDPINRHNWEAPTQQNRLCNLRSVWEVILDSPDFANGTNPRIDGFFNTTPTFQVIQAESFRRYVLVLDTSGSMAGERLDKMRQAVSVFISRFVPDGDEVALVEFSTVASRLTGLRKISTTLDRNFLLNEIPSFATGSTCIGCGIGEAIRILESGSNTATGANIIVFTDGEENTAPMVADVRNTVLLKKAIVYAMFLVTQGNAALKELAIESGGKWFQLGINSNSTTINDVFAFLAASEEGDVFSEAFRVHSTSLSVTSYNPGSGKVPLDGSLGENTSFIFTWSNQRIDVTLQSPSKCYYTTKTVQGLKLCPNQISPVIENRFNTITFNLPGVAQSGTWKYYVETSGFLAEEVTVTVTSKAANRTVAPIIVRSGIDKPKAGLGEAVVIFAQVTQNFIPVLGATVWATIESSRSKQKVQLFDNGAGPDVRKNDGIYSRYFSKFDFRGRYAIQIIVSKEEPEGQTEDIQNINPASRANLNIAIARRNGSIEINPSAKEYLKPAQNSAKTGNFSRVVIAPGFEYTGPPESLLSDHIPPNKITDLAASLIRENNTDDVQIELVFTAPGSDFDSGRAAYYTIRYVVNNLSSLIEDFNSSSLVNNSDIVVGNLSDPLEAGSTETFILNPPLPNSTDRIVLGFSIQAFDDSGNASPPSNVAPITFLREIPVLPTESPTTTATEGTTTTIGTVATEDTTTTIKTVATEDTTTAIGTVATEDTTTPGGTAVVPGISFKLLCLHLLVFILASLW